MRSEFEDRFTEARYRDDETYGLCLTPDPRDTTAVATEAWVGERMLLRLRYLGLAYELPLLSRLPAKGNWSYPEVQLPALGDEIAFVLERVDDPLLAAEVRDFGDLINLAGKQRRGWLLVVESP